MEFKFREFKRRPDLGSMVARERFELSSAERQL